MKKADAETLPPVLSRTERIVAWLVGTTLVAALLLLVLGNAVFVTVGPGEAGVRYRLLDGGTETGAILPEGFAMKWPWDRIYRYEVRVQQEPFEIHALSAEGMTVTVRGNILYRPREATLGVLHKTIGPDYRHRIIVPPTISALRKVIAMLNSHELYTSSFVDLQAALRRELDADAGSTLVEFLDIPIRSVELPGNVTTAIEQKLSQEQLAAAYEFRLLREKQEAERLRIEAIGIRTYYAIVAEALTDPVLTWRGIQATVGLAHSPNSKVVVVGGGKDQMPLILGSDIARAPDTPMAIAPMSPADAMALPSDLGDPVLFPEIATSIDSRGAIRTPGDGSPMPFTPSGTAPRASPPPAGPSGTPPPGP